MKAFDILTGEETEVSFFSAYKRPVKDSSEVMDDFTITETGYIPPQVQIQEMINAGLRLAEERKARFDSRELGVEEFEDQEEMGLDLMREPNLDMVDVSKASTKVYNKAKAEAERQAEAKRTAEAASKAAEEKKAEAKG